MLFMETREGVGGEGGDMQERQSNLSTGYESIT